MKRYLLLLVPAVVGCNLDRIAENQRAMLEQLAEMSAAAERVPGELLVRDAQISGDIGVVQGFEAPAQQVDASYDRDLDTTRVSLQGLDARERMGMMILNLEGADLRTLPPGEYEFGGLGMARPLPYGATASVTGCSSDPGCGDCNYDAPTDRGVIIIEDPEPEPDSACDDEAPAVEHRRNVIVQAELPTADGWGTTLAHGTFTVR
jgi:hypothetical protein